jgi:hypothetical protein
MKFHQQLRAELWQSRECRRKLPQHPFPRRDSDLWAAPLVFFCWALFRTLYMRYISAPYSDSDPPATRQDAGMHSRRSGLYARRQRTQNPEYRT